MRRTLVRCAVAVLVLLLAAAAGLYTAATLAPERLRQTIERELREAIGAPCDLQHLRLVPGLPLELEGRGLALWNGELRVEQIAARVSFGAALFGELHLSRLELRGARLRASWQDSLVLPWSEAPRSKEEVREASVAPPLAAAAAIEGALGRILEEALVADTLRVRDSRIALHGPGEGAPLLFALEIPRGELFHSRLRRTAELSARTRIVADGNARGVLEWKASRYRDGPPRLAVTATGLDLAWLGRRIPGMPLRARGSLDGSAEYRLPVPGRSSLDLDLVLRDFAWVDAASGELVAPSAPVEVALELALDEERLQVSRARVRSDVLSFELDAVLARPLGPGANLGLQLRFADLDLARTRRLLVSLPEPWGERARAVTSPLEGGRIAAFEARGAAPLRRWRELLEGHSSALPRGLALKTRLEDLSLLLGEEDRIEEISGELAWTEGRLEIRGATGRRAGVPLPILDLTLEGTSHLLAADLSRRVEASREILLPGTTLLLSAFERAGDAAAKPPRVALWIERLEHPALLWPVEDLDMEVRARGEALVAEVRHLLWAKVPFRGELTWQDDPEHLAIHFEAAAQSELAAESLSGRSVAPPRPDPEQAPPAPDAPAGRVWATGRFELGPLRIGVWKHEWLRGRFEALRSEVRIRELEAELAPRGHLGGHGHLDLGRPDALPFGAGFAARDLDASALLAQAGLGEELVTGSVDLRGELEDRYTPGMAPFSHLNGHLHIEARDGVIEQELPAVLALTMASQGLDFTPGRENIRYERISVPAQLRDGVVSTERLELDGPDVRVFGSGTLDLARPPHRLEAELALFLFRPVDWAIGAIPFLNTLLLGDSQNLVAAHFELEGPWDDPVAEAKPLRTLTRGSMDVVKGIPRVVVRGLEMLGVMDGEEDDAEGSGEAEPGGGTTP